MRTAELAVETGLTPKGVEYHLTKLKRDNLLSRVGGRKEGKWVVE